MATSSTTHKNDGSDDPIYLARLADWKYRGERACIMVVIGLGVAAFILTSLAHLILVTVLPEEARQPINFWLTFPLGTLFLWFLEIGVILSQWNLWLKVRENHLHVVYNLFGGEKMLLRGEDLYFIPPWWEAKPENLVNLEVMTFPLPEHTYRVQDGKGGVKTTGMFSVLIPFAEAGEFIKIDQTEMSVMERLTRSIKARIGPEIAKSDIDTIIGNTKAVSDAISAMFASRGEVEVACHVDIVSVTIEDIYPDDATREALEKAMQAEKERKMIADKTAWLREGGKADGAIITDEKIRFDLAVAMDKDPKRQTDRKENKQDIHITLDPNTAEAFKGFGAAAPALLAAITALGLLKGGGDGDKDKGGKKPKK
ncbi:MAG: SPFH domain-containing protein [bacterium]|nr:SPFH domain-containing protein [bacterium]